MWCSLLNQLQQNIQNISTYVQKTKNYTEFSQIENETIRDSQSEEPMASYKVIKHT